MRFVWNCEWIAKSLVKFTGDPTKAAYALYDEIDVSSIKVQASDGELLKVKEFVTKTSDGKNAIGFKLGVNNDTTDKTPKMEELKVSFKTNDGQEYFTYGILARNPMQEAQAEVTVDNVEDFLYYYNTSVNATTIYLESGTYSFDFVHNRDNIKVLPKPGATVIFNGDPNTTNPVVTFDVANPAQFGDIIIDGRNQTKDGLYATENANMYASGFTIRNCNIAVQCNNHRAFYANNSTYENNKIAIVTGYTAGYTSIERNIFKMHFI